MIETMPIVLASDENYAQQMYVTVFSALMNKSRNIFYDFYILIPDSFTTKMINKYIQLETQFSNCKINFINMKNEFCDLKMQIAHITLPTYYRLKIADLLPQKYSKAIYLDTDVIVQGNLNDLYNINLENNFIAGVKAAGYVLSTTNRIK